MAKRQERVDDYLKDLCDQAGVCYIGRAPHKSLVTFSCPKHPDKGEQTIQQSTLKRWAKRKSCNCSLRNKDEKDIVAAKGFNPNIEIISPYVNFKTSIECRCKVCGATFTLKPYTLQHGGRCPVCEPNKRGLIASDEYQRRFTEQQHSFTLLSVYKSSTQNVVLMCNKCGEIFERKASLALYGRVKCPRCAADEFHDEMALSQEEVVARIKEARSDIEVVGKYEGVNKPLMVRCLKCKTIYEMPQAAYGWLGTTKCPKCGQKASHGERAISHWLERKEVLFIPQKAFEKCRNKIKLHFDFYLPEYNLCIEYQGQQHYYPVDFSGKITEPEELQRKFNEGQERDNIKRAFCAANNLRLLEIPFWDFDRIEEILQNEIDSLNSKTVETVIGTMAT